MFSWFIGKRYKRFKEIELDTIYLMDRQKALEIKLDNNLLTGEEKNHLRDMLERYSEIDELLDNFKKSKDFKDNDKKPVQVHLGLSTLWKQQLHIDLMLKRLEANQKRIFIAFDKFLEKYNDLCKSEEELKLIKQLLKGEENDV